MILLAVLRTVFRKQITVVLSLVIQFSQDITVMVISREFLVLDLLLNELTGEQFPLRVGMTG